MATDCLFCKMISGVIKPATVHEDDDVLAFKDINPQAPVHVLVIPQAPHRHAQRSEARGCALVGKLVLVAGKHRARAGRGRQRLPHGHELQRRRRPVSVACPSAFAWRTGHALAAGLKNNGAEGAVVCDPPGMEAAPGHPGPHAALLHPWREEKGRERRAWLRNPGKYRSERNVVVEIRAGPGRTLGLVLGLTLGPRHCRPRPLAARPGCSCRSARPGRNASPTSASRWRRSRWCSGPCLPCRPTCASATGPRHKSANLSSGIRPQSPRAARRTPPGAIQVFSCFSPLVLSFQDSVVASVQLATAEPFGE